MVTKKRNKIPANIENLVLYQSAWFCNVCRRYHKYIHIHHIDNNPSNNSPENLIVLCLECHDEAHTKHELSKNLTSERLTYFKKEWEKEVSQAVLKSMLPSDDNFLEMSIWTFISHEKIVKLIKSYSISFENEVLKFLIHSKNVDKYGIPILKNINTERCKYVTIYDYFDFGNRQRFHGMYSDAVNALILKLKPIEIGAIWNKEKIQSLVTPGSFIFVRRNFYFKRGKIINKEETRFIHTESQQIQIRYYANTRNMFGDSSIYNTFCGFKFIAAFLLVKNIVDENNVLILDCTPISMGVGFQKKEYLSPVVV